MQRFYSHGKLLLSAEYLVLDGATSLALPTKFGQSLIIETNNCKKIKWSSYNVSKSCWFKAEFDLETFEIKNCNDNKVAKTLQEILKTALFLNPTFLKRTAGVVVETHLDFPNKWGLGTSSTLINNIASWANVNAFELLEKSFGGSGYDIACAQHDFPIAYKRNGIQPEVKRVNFNPDFKENIFFVYSNQKQDSKQGIKMYRSLVLDKLPLIEKANGITKKMIEAQSLEAFELLVENHEMLISNLLGMESVKQKMFSDFKGAVKSLGAWGGDFVLVTGDEKYIKSYFLSKGYHTILSYADMVLG